MAARSLLVASGRVSVAGTEVLLTPTVTDGERRLYMIEIWTESGSTALNYKINSTTAVTYDAANYNILPGMVPFRTVVLGIFNLRFIASGATAVVNYRVEEIPTNAVGNAIY